MKKYILKVNSRGDITGRIVYEAVLYDIHVFNGSVIITEKCKTKNPTQDDYRTKYYFNIYTVDFTSSSVKRIFGGIGCNNLINKGIVYPYENQLLYFKPCGSGYAWYIYENSEEKYMCMMDDDRDTCAGFKDDNTRIASSLRKKRAL